MTNEIHYTIDNHVIRGFRPLLNDDPTGFYLVSIQVENCWEQWETDLWNLDVSDVEAFLRELVDCGAIVHHGLIVRWFVSEIISGSLM